MTDVPNGYLLEVRRGASGTDPIALAAHDHRPPRPRLACRGHSRKTGGRHPESGRDSQGAAGGSQHSLDSTVQSQKPPSVEAHEPRTLWLDRGPDRLQTHEQSLPGIRDSSRIARQKRHPRAARERLPQAHPRMNAKCLGGERHLPHHLRSPRLRGQRHRLLQKGIARRARSRRRDGELKAW